MLMCCAFKKQSQPRLKSLPALGNRDEERHQQDLRSCPSAGKPKGRKPFRENFRKKSELDSALG